jgi:cytochrome c peroxidase
MKKQLFLSGVCLVLALAFIPSAGKAAGSGDDDFHLGQEMRYCGEEPCAAVARGFHNFLDRKLKDMRGNGRSCADCHMPIDSFQLSPAIAELRFQLARLQHGLNPRAEDPLFLPIDADDFRTNGAKASDFSNLRQNGLVRITFNLPPNMKLIDPATNQPSNETFVDVWRMVPSVFNVKLTGPDGQNAWPRGPNTTGGYQLDGRFATLQEQALGALMNHAQIQSAPDLQFVDDLASFQNLLFSSRGVRDLSGALDAGIAELPDPDPPLTEFEQQGKTVFIRACAQCHDGPGQSSARVPIRRFHDINTQCPRAVDTVSPPRWQFTPCPTRLARNARTYEITLANGSKIRRTSSDPGRALLTGFVGGLPAADDWNKFDMPGLHGIGKTAPYFHNNSADTLEDVVDHYIQFFKFVQANAAPGVIPPIASTDGIHFDRAPTPEERAALVAYLKKL